jgi:hypothetical protein
VLPAVAGGASIIASYLLAGKSVIPQLDCLARHYTERGFSVRSQAQIFTLTVPARIPSVPQRESATRAGRATPPG